MCTQTAQVWLSPNTRIDTDAAAARLRAANRWGTPALHSTVAAAPPARPSPQWNEWAAHDARIATRPVPYIGEAPPAPEPDRQYVGVQIARTATGADGWRRQLPEVTVYCTVRPDNGRWLIEDLQTSQTQGDS